MYTQSLSRVWFFATPWTVACQAALSMEFSRQEYWGGLPFPTPGDLPKPGIRTTFLVSPVLAGGFNYYNLMLRATIWDRCYHYFNFTNKEIEPQIKYSAAAAAKSLQSCLTLYDPIDSSPPGSPIPGILQARTLEWVAISFSKRSSQPRNWTHISYISWIGRQILYQLSQWGSPK